MLDLDVSGGCKALTFNNNFFLYSDTAPWSNRSFITLGGWNARGGAKIAFAYIQSCSIAGFVVSFILISFIILSSSHTYISALNDLTGPSAWAKP